jgi:SAM-dependent methyltransferase
MNPEPSFDSRTRGSPDDFEADWQDALRTKDSRWLVYPDASAHDQVSLMEAVKARQVVETLRRHGIASGRTLEYGCGAAGMSIYLANRGFDAVALDLSESALKIARANVERHATGNRRIKLLAGDTLGLPFEDGAFDVVMSFGLLEHFDVATLHILLGEVTRVLRPGGVFVADIIPAGFNARAVGTAVNLVGALVARVLAGKVGELAAVRDAYLSHYYETALSPADWRDALAIHGLREITVKVCRPFPLLAISGSAERAYVNALRAMLPLWRRFDDSTLPFKHRWGWMYLASGVRAVD